MSESTASEARLAANRANARHSTGPRTKAGKAKISLNAVKTGLTGRTVLLPSEEAAPYEALLVEYQKALQPVGVQERALVQSMLAEQAPTGRPETIVDCRWRLDRIPGLEMALLSLIRREWVGRDAKYNKPTFAIMTEMAIAASTPKNSATCKFRRPASSAAVKRKWPNCSACSTSARPSKPPPSLKPPKPASSPPTPSSPSSSQPLALNFQLGDLRRTSPLSPPPANDNCCRKPSKETPKPCQPPPSRFHLTWYPV